MLNISSNNINGCISRERFYSLSYVESRISGNVLLKILLVVFGLLLVVLFLPWTQNIRSRGSVTTLKPDQRPHTIHSVIGGRIEKWFVQEGDYVNKGDTILHISEIKDEYFDPDLLARTGEQLKSKENVVNSYHNKVKALDNQIEALIITSQLKLQQEQNKLKQVKLKIASDSIEYVAAIINHDIARKQYERMEQLHKDGLKSLTDLESRKLILQKTEAELISKENKLLTTRNEEINVIMELSSIQSQYRDEISKAESEKYNALSNMYDSEALVTKLHSTYKNYSVRNRMYFITAPQDGYVTKAMQYGLGETIKAGEQIVSIMPARYDLTVEMYVRPIDLPLLEKGQQVRIQFDGWPAIVFSGWPNTSYGTYGGRLFAIDNFISENGKYRVLVAPDPDDHKWPDALRVGAGTSNILLLKDVSMWYELWRQINGFPPNYYKINKSEKVNKT